MSLLGGMLAGAATGGAQAVTDIANMTLEDRRTKALEKMRLDNTMMLDDRRYERDLSRDETQYQRQQERDQQQRQWQVEDRNFAIANRAPSGGSSINPQVKLMVDTLNGDIERMSEQLSSGMLGEEESKLLSQQMNQALQQRNQLVGLGFGGDNSSPTNPLLADLANGGGIADPDSIDDPSSGGSSSVGDSNQGGLLQRILQNAPQNQRTQQFIDSELQGVDQSNPVAVTDAAINIQDKLNDRTFGERRMDSALARGESRASARQASIPQSQREIAEFQSKYLNDQVQISREEAIQIYPLITSPVVRDKLKRDFDL